MIGFVIGAGFMALVAGLASAATTATRITDRLEHVTLTWHQLHTLLESVAHGDSIHEAMLTAEDWQETH